MFNAIDERSFKQSLKQGDLSSKTWVVSDIHSKSLLQTQFLKERKYLAEDSVLRVSELWQKILRRKFPEHEIVSSHFISVMLGEWLRGQNISWAHYPGTPGILANYINQFLPVLASERSAQMMRDWLREHPESLLRWGGWFELASLAWDYFCQHKMLSAKWVSGFLSSQDWDETYWARDLIFNIGPDIISVEVELIKKLSEFRNVTVVMPEPSEIQSFYTTLWPYEFLSGKKIQTEISQHKYEPHELVSCRRYTTQLGEIKSATAKVRSWLESGVEPQQIGILAADIEHYWPVLNSYCETEGIPVAKDTLMRATSVPGVSKWLSRLNLESQNIEAGDLEASLYSDKSAPIMAYEKFSQFFSNVYDDTDLKRDMAVYNSFQFKFKNSEKLSRDDFFMWALQFWTDDLQAIEKVAAGLLTECPANVKLELRSWISYVAAIVSKVEIKVKPGINSGVICASLDAAQNMDFEYIYFLGMSESQMESVSDVAVTRAEVIQIVQDLGFYLDSPDQRYHEYLVQKILKRKHSGAELSFAATNFLGQVDSPALLWLFTSLAQGGDLDSYAVADHTRWDELQIKLQNQNVQVTSNVSIKARKEIRYSASQLEKYLQCPFVFAAEKLFHLSDLPSVDLDVDHMTSGNLIHSLLDKLLEPPIKLDRADADILLLIDKLRDQIGRPVGDERLWSAKRQHYLRTARRFLNFEAEWRKSFPNTVTMARELRVNGEFEIEQNKKISITGSIDRVDSYKGQHDAQYVVLDYKSSASGVRNHGSWLSGNELQLAFYAMAIEQGLTELPKADVVGAFYYTLSNMEREKGYRLNEAVGNLFSENKRNRSQLSREERNELFANLKTVIADVVRNIEGGEFSPNPKDRNDCNSCNWSTLCRAPHLN